MLLPLSYSSDNSSKKNCLPVFVLHFPKELKNEHVEREDSNLRRLMPADLQSAL